jgi:hypothetical protein
MMTKAYNPRPYGRTSMRASIRSPVPVPEMAEMAMGWWPSSQKSAACSSARATFSHLFTASTTCTEFDLSVFKVQSFGIIWQLLCAAACSVALGVPGISLIPACIRGRWSRGT